MGWGLCPTEPGKGTTLGEVILLVSMSVSLLFEEQVAIGRKEVSPASPTRYERKAAQSVGYAQEPLGEIPNVEAHDESLQHLARVDAFVAQHLVIHLDAWPYKKHAQQVNAVEAR